MNRRSRTSERPRWCVCEQTLVAETTTEANIRKEKEKEKENAYGSNDETEEEEENSEEKDDFCFNDPFFATDVVVKTKAAVSLREARAEKDAEEMKSKEEASWLTSDATHALRIIEETCGRNIWNKNDGDCAFGNEAESDDAQQRLTSRWPKLVSTGWYDAILALLLLLCPNVEKLVIESSGQHAPKRDVEMQDDETSEAICVGGWCDCDLLKRLFSVAIKSQENPSNAMDDVILPKLRTLVISGPGYSDHHRRFQWLDTLPYVFLPCLETVVLRRLSFDNKFSDDLENTQSLPHIKTLDLSCTTYDFDGLIQLLRICPNVQTLKYSTNGDHSRSATKESWARLIVEIASAAPQLKHLLLGELGLFEPCIEDLVSFKNLETLSLRWNHICVQNEVSNLWSLLPHSLKKLNITSKWSFDRNGPSSLMCLLQSMPGAKYDGLISNLQEVTVDQKNSVELLILSVNCFGLTARIIFSLEGEE